MKSPALHRGIRKAIRTLLQLAAGGGLTALVGVFAEGLDGRTQGLIMAGWTTLVTLIQNTAEASGLVPVLLPTPGLVPSVGVFKQNVGTVDTTVETVGDAVGEVAGTVTGTDGELMGEVVDVDRMEPQDD
jgi:hypothetical protein